MTDQTTAQSPQPTPPQQSCRRRRGRGVLFVLFLILIAAVSGALAGKAVSRGFGHGYGYGFGERIAGPIDGPRFEEKADRFVRRVMVDVDATYEQQDKIRAIVKSAVRDLVPMAEKAQYARREGRALLAQPTLDRAAIEKYRAEQVALVDAFSKRLAQAVGDANEVLTPEQRRKLQDRMAQRRPWGWRHFG